MIIDDKYILAIETSCDDTSIAIFKNSKLITHQFCSSTNQFKNIGGIIPEIAARNHANNINYLIEKALKSSGVYLEEITNIAYTAYPGLPGSLHVGKIVGKCLSYLINKKPIQIDHLMGHAFSFAIENKELISFPFISVVVSGGNTIIYLHKSVTKYQILNKTNDDAVGEALDKIGRTLGFDYPGGISIDKHYNENKIIPMIKHHSPEDKFSFSGIKNHIIYEAHKDNKKIDAISLGSSALKWCVDEIVLKTKYYAKKYNVKTIAVGGGVCNNSLLRKEIVKIDDCNVYLTKKEYTGDNAIMIGFYAYLLSNI